VTSTPSPPSAFITTTARCWPRTEDGDQVSAPSDAGADPECLIGGLRQVGGLQRVGGCGRQVDRQSAAGQPDPGDRGVGRTVEVRARSLSRARPRNKRGAADNGERGLAAAGERMSRRSTASTSVTTIARPSVACARGRR